MRPAWRVAGLAFLTWFFVQAVQQFVPAVYAKNIDALRLGPSALAVLLFLAPVAYVAFRDLRPERLALPLAAAVVAFRVLLSVPLGLDGRLAFSGLAIAAYMLYLPVHLVRGRDAASPGTDAAAFVLGFGLDAASRSGDLGSDPTMGPWGLALVVPLAAIALLAVRRTPVPPPEAPMPGTDRRRLPRAALGGVAFGALLGLQLTLLAYPAVLARFAAAPLFPMTVAVLAGMGVGVALVLGGVNLRPLSMLAGNAILFAAVVDVALVGSPALPVLVLLAQVVLVLDLALAFGYLRRAPGLRAAGAFATVGGVVLVLYLFAFVFALAYAFVPGRGLWEGNLPAFLLVAALAVAVPAVVLAARAHRHGLWPTAAPSGLRYAVTWAVTVVLAFAALGAYPSTPPPSDGAVVLSVMSYNIHQGFGQDGVLDVERIRDVIRAANADIVALQESDGARITSGNQDLVRALAQLGYHEAYGPPTRDQIFGVAILSRFPIRDWRVVPLPSLEAQRVAVEAEVQIGAGVVTVVSVHFGLPAEERAMQAAFLMNRTASLPRPVLLLGDFNSCPGGQCPGDAAPDTVYAQLAAGWTDAWAAMGNAPTDPAGHTWPASSPDRRIDYVFVDGLFVESAEVVRTALTAVASDHLPVLVTVRSP